MSANSAARLANEASSFASAGSNPRSVASSAARWTADGNTSLDDCPMFTWSLGWTSSPARLASTSLAFMFDDVPDPVWNTSIGNWSSNSPSATRSPAAAIRCASSGSSSSSSALTRAAAPLIRPSQWITPAGTVSPEIGKFPIALVVSPPQSCFSWRLISSFRVLSRSGVDGSARRPARTDDPGPVQPQNAISSRATPTGSS